MTSLRILIIGDGVVGLSIAWRLVSDGHDVVCLGDGGTRSSEAAAGMLAPSFERYHPRAAGALGDLLEEGLTAWGPFADDLIAEAGDRFLYRRNGIVGIGFARPLSREAEPYDVPDGFTSERAFLMPEEGQADPRLLRGVLAEAITAKGGQLRTGHAHELKLASTGARVETDTETLAADLIVLAGGHGVSRLIGDPYKEEGVRGRAFLHYAPQIRLPQVVRSPSVYFCPKPDDHLYVGATEEVEAGEPAMLDGLWWEALALLPALKETERVAIYDGVRPALGNGLPQIGEWPKDERVLLAFGHDRNGVLLAPLTADRIRGFVRARLA